MGAASSPLKGLSVNIMKFLAFLLFSSALALPRPAEEEMVAEEQDIAAVPYVHEEIEAEPYVHEDIAAEPYVHEEIDALPYVHEEVAYNHEDIPAEEYVHVEGAPEPVVAPVVYTGYPYVHHYAGYPYAAFPYAGIPTLTAAVAKPEAEEVAETKAATPVVSPLAYAAYPYAAYPYFNFVHTGCVNSVGSVVPCA